MMKVVHFIPTLDIGGAEMALVRLVLHLSREKKFEHMIVTIKPSRSWLSEQVQESGIEYVSLLSHDSFLPRVLTSWRAINNFGPNIFHGWSYHGNILSYLFFILFGFRIPLIWGVRHSLRKVSDESLATKIALFFSVVISWLPNFLRPKTIIYNSDMSRVQHEKLGVRSRFPLTIANGIPMREYETSNLREELGISDDDFFVLHVARFHKMKGHALLLRAFAEFYSEHPDAVLVMAGRGVDDSNLELSSLIKALDLQGRVHLIGEQQEIFGVFRAADLFVLSSIFGEGFPNTVAEAMVSKLPVVATDVGDTSYLVGKTGLIVEPNSREALVRAISQIKMMDKSERARLGIAAHKRVEELFSEKICADKYEEVYFQLAAA